MHEKRSTIMVTVIFKAYTCLLFIMDTNMNSRQVDISHFLVISFAVNCQAEIIFSVSHMKTILLFNRSISTLTLMFWKIKIFHSISCYKAPNQLHFGKKRVAHSISFGKYNNITTERLILSHNLRVTQTLLSLSSCR